MLKTSQTDTVPFTPATDYLGHTASLDHCSSYPLLGVPLHIRSNSPAVIAATERSFAQWGRLAAEFVVPGPPARMDIVVHGSTNSGELDTPRAPFVHRLHGDTFLAASGPNLLTAQLRSGQGLAFVTPSMVADDVHFRYNVLECLGLMLVTRRDRVAVHTGAVVRNGRAVLLCGQSRAGKSTLCYACVRQGFTLLTEDVVYVSLDDGLRVWGNPGRIHLLPDAPRLFPELMGIPPQVQANGKLKLAIEVIPPDGKEIPFFADRAVICALERHDEPKSTLEPLDPDTFVDAISLASEPGFDISKDRHAAASALVQEDVYRLHLGNDLGHAVALPKEITD